MPDRVDLVAPIVRFTTHPGQSLPDPRLSALTINVPIASALMQSVSGVDLSVALARCGGLSFIFGAQSIESQVDMVRRVKTHKAGFVVSDSNVRLHATLADVLERTEQTGHSTVAVTDDGSANGKLLGIITSRDYRLGRESPSKPVADIMTPYSDLQCAPAGIDLSAANDMLWQYKLNCLPIVDQRQRLQHLVFRKDHDAHQEYPLENVDSDKRLIVGAALNTRDHVRRVPALIEAGVDVLCIDSSDGYSEWQADTIAFVKSNFPGTPIGAGNVVDREGFLYLVEAGADFVKVGIGGGSICITREQKGIGRGQASTVLEVAEARDEYYNRTGIYVPVCSDGGISQDYHIAIALAMGADFVMMGRYFARFDEAPGRKIRVNNQYVKEYWGEGSNRARNWQRYDHGGENTQPTWRLSFEEGVDSYVPYAGRLRDSLNLTLLKIRSTMCNCGALNLGEFRQHARLTAVSPASIREGGAHDVVVRDGDNELDRN